VVLRHSKDEDAKWDCSCGQRLTVSHHRWSSYLGKDLKMKIQTLNEQAGGLRSAGSEGIKLSYIFNVGWDTSGSLFQVASR